MVQRAPVKHRVGGLEQWGFRTMGMARGLARAPTRMRTATGTSESILMTRCTAGAPTRITLGLQYVNNVLLGNTWIVKAPRQLLSVRIADLVHTPIQREVLLVRNVQVANIVT